MPGKQWRTIPGINNFFPWFILILELVFNKTLPHLKSQRPKRRRVPWSLKPPPRPSNVTRVGEATAVPLARKQFPASPTLQEPGKKRKKRSPVVGEPSVPDVEEDFSRLQMGKADLSKIGEVVGDMLASDGESDGKRRRTGHERRFKSRKKTETETQDEDLASWLAMKQITYPTWTSFHRSTSTLSKASVCEHRGWKQFRTMLRAQNPITCAACKGLLEFHKVTEQDVEQVLQGHMSSLQLKEQPPPENPQTGENTTGISTKLDESTTGTDAEELTEYQRCVNFVKSKASEVELIEKNVGEVLKFRCLICLTRRQPMGKVNKLGRPVLKLVMHYLNQHLKSPTHLAHLEERRRAQNPKLSTETCPGLCATDQGGSTVLSLHQDDFKLWLQFCNTSGNKLQHTYWCEMNSNLWFVRHKNCQRSFQRVDGSQQTCCPECASLGDSTGITKRLVKFCAKFYCARLLQKRLFGTEDDVQQVLDDVKKSAFGQRHSKFWTKLSGLSNAELQTYTRKCFCSVPQADRTPAFETFFATVVDPCCRVHVSALGSNVAALSAQFLDALENQEFNATCCGLAVEWLVSGGWILFDVDNFSVVHSRILANWMFLSSYSWKKSSTTCDARNAFFMGLKIVFGHR